MDQYLAVAREAARAAAKVTTAYYKSDLQVSIKADRSPVTQADTEAEKAIITTIGEHFPDHAFFGEETGRTGQSEFVWLVDPIDGTKNFIDGIPLWGTLIALVHSGETVVGLSDMPIIEESVWAVKGQGAFRKGTRVKVSDRGTIKDAMISFGSLNPFRKLGREQGLLNMLHDARRHRAFGDCWPFHLLASGNLDIVTEALIKPVDVGCFDIITREAGGRFSDLDGNPFSFEISHVIASNGLVHDDVLDYLAAT